MNPASSTPMATTTEHDTTKLSDFVCEQALMLGAGSTVFYQMADLGTGLGVAEHSTTLQRPIDRLRITLVYVYMMTCGSDEERDKITRMVNKAHVPVRSEGRYNAFDPELQLWVAATLAHNGISIYERVFGPLDDASRERVYRDSQIFGTALQVKQEQWPETYADFQEYWDKKLSSLESHPTVRMYCQQLINTDDAQIYLKPLLPLQGLMTRGNLDPRARDVLGISWTPRDQRRYNLFWRVFPPVYRRVPKFIRTAPARALMWDSRRRLKKHASVR